MEPGQSPRWDVPWHSLQRWLSWGALFHIPDVTHSTGAHMAKDDKPRLHDSSAARCPEDQGTEAQHICTWAGSESQGAMCNWVQTAETAPMPGPAGLVKALDDWSRKPPPALAKAPEQPQGVCPLPSLWQALSRSQKVLFC
jgi:hypothetical protein